MSENYQPLPPSLANHEPFDFNAPGDHPMRGYLRLPNAATAVVVRFHGLAGSAGGNEALVAATSHALHENSIGYMLVDGSGTGSQSETEVFGDSLAKITAAITALAERAPHIKLVLLEGFSLGASKVVARMLRRNKPTDLPVGGLVLESWTNVPIWMQAQPNFLEVYYKALQLATSGRGKQLVTENFGSFNLAYNADAFLAAVDGEINVYNRVNDIDIPTLVVASPTDEHVMLGIAGITEYKLLFRNPKIKVETEAGGHAFEGHEQQVARRVAYMAIGTVWHHNRS